MDKSKHTCTEMTEAMGVDYTKYPRAITYCRTCRREMRRIPLDDLPAETFETMIQLLRDARKGRKG